MKSIGIGLLVVCLLAAASNFFVGGVVRGELGQPLAGLEVTLTDLESGYTFSIFTGSDGGFRFENRPAGRYSLEIRRAGGLLARREIRLGQNWHEAFRVAGTGIAAGTAHGVIGGIFGAVPTAPPPPPPAGVNYFMVPMGPPLESAEEYDAPGEEGFALTARRPLSTFSADVDTASYSNIRRFLRDGRMPPPASVRIEEMLNYFRYADADPPEGHPFSITAAMAACPWQPEHGLVRIGLRTRAIPTEKLPPANLVMLIDVSGSMHAANKLPLLKRSLALLVEQLRPRDRVALVVYAGAAGLVLPSTPGSDKPRILASLESLQAGGSTAGAAGLRLAYRTARAHLLRNGTNRVILATDGDFNVGQSSDAEMVKLIEEERAHGVFLTVLGFGYGNLKDAKLEKLADHGNGHFAYIDSILEARRALVEELGATLMTVAKDVKLQVEFNPAHIRAWRLIGYQNRRLKTEDFKDDRKDAADMGAGHGVTALYEVVPLGAATPVADSGDLKYQRTEATPAQRNGEALTLKVRYKEPRAATSVEMVHTLAWSREPMERAAGDLRFAAGIAQWGMLLGESAHKAGSNYESAIGLVEGAVAPDSDGRRAEAVYLMKTARALVAAAK